MVIIPQTLHRCRNIQRYIFSISGIRPVILSHARYVVLLQMTSTIYRHVVWVVARQLTALKTLWHCAESIMKCMATANNGKSGCKKFMI